VWRGGEIAGLAALRPSVVFDAAAGIEILEVIFPYLEDLSVGLVKSSVPAVDEVWKYLGSRRSRRAIVDRLETTYVLREADTQFVEERPDAHFRVAGYSDLSELVIAARESLREESRPDPFCGDITNFQRWVRGRIPRARLVVSGGRITMVAYADVQRPEGWLLQGIYTWPNLRRRGFGAFGVSELCREAFRAGASHVQLAVIEGNAAAHGLYERLGFKAAGKLRTILFA